MVKLWVKAVVTLLALAVLLAVAATAYAVLRVGSDGGMKPEVFANLVFSALLVAVTVFYAWQSAIAAREMKTARAPHVDVDVRRFGDNFVSYVRNVGGGPALDVSLVLTLSSDSHDLSEQWDRSLLQGEEQVLLFPRVGGGLLTQTEVIAGAAVLKARGTCRDIRGETWQIDKTVDLASRFSSHIEGDIRDVQSRLYSNVESMRKAIESIAQDLHNAG